MCKVNGLLFLETAVSLPPQLLLAAETMRHVPPTMLGCLSLEKKIKLDVAVLGK